MRTARSVGMAQASAPTAARAAATTTRVVTSVVVIPNSVPGLELLAGPNVGPDGNTYAVQDTQLDGEGLGHFSLDAAGALRYSEVVYWSFAGGNSGRVLLGIHGKLDPGTGAMHLRYRDARVRPPGLDHILQAFDRHPEHIETGPNVPDRCRCRYFHSIHAGYPMLTAGACQKATFTAGTDLQVPFQGRLQPLSVSVVKQVEASRLPVAFRRNGEVHMKTRELSHLAFHAQMPRVLLHDGVTDEQSHAFADGTLALSKDYFILVAGDAHSAVTGYGKYTQTGDALTLNVIRWAQSDGEATNNIQDTIMQASFDGSVLSLPDGKSFTVVR